MRLLPVVGVVLSLAACGDPLAGLDRLADVNVSETDPAAAALPTDAEIAREAFIGTSAAEGALPEGVSDASMAAPQGPGGFLRGLMRRAAAVDPAEAIAADVGHSQARQRSTAMGNVDGVAVAMQAVTADGEAAPVLVAALAPEAEAPPRRTGLGLFGGRGGSESADTPRKGPDARDVAFGTQLPFGEIARVCDAKGQSLGKQVATLGRRSFKLYDSNAGIKDKRTFYVTGFGDDCPRQFTAANALFGAPSFYETIRFSPAGEHMPHAATDTAYDKVKTSVCRVGRKKPCGGQIDKLDSTLAFVSAYEFHEHNSEWKEFLVYDGTVLAGAVKSN